MSLAPGARLGPYEVLSLIGAGGMGEVYRARDSRLNRDVAIKVLPPAFSADTSRLERFEQEARAAAALNHPNILAVHDVGTHSSTGSGQASPFIVAELLAGETLRERLASGTLPVRKAIDYAIQIARGVAAAHDKGIVHRDLKPENIFITDDGRVKILDFGLAKLTQSEAPLVAGTNVPTTPIDYALGRPAAQKTEPGMVRGTIGYMAPEQVRGQAVDHRADIFAFGAVLYEMLSGRRAFDGETTIDTMTAILKEDPPDLPAAERHIPPALERIVDRCLEKTPGARFQDASDLAFALESLSSQSERSEVAGAAPVHPPPRARERLAWTVAALTFVALAATIGVSYFSSTPVSALAALSLSANQTPPTRPNVLLAIADDWSWPHAGAYGDPTVKTPVFDRIAREGVLFARAFAAAPSCTPSRAALLTGRYPHQLEEGGVLHGFLPAKFPAYTDLLEQAGYHVGFTRKGWGPGRFEAGGRTRNPAGPAFSDFDAFLRARRAGQPFVFWFGSQDPHRPYEEGSGAASGIDVTSIRVPAFLPDTPEVRRDLADYYFEVQRFDRELGEIVDRLRALGELDNTLVVVTADNGMPFPRAKANVYDAGARVPLAMRWPGRAKAGLVTDAFVNLSDLAPTFLEAAGVTRPDSMSARSILDLAAGGAAQARDNVFLERERHAHVRRGNLSYPVRAVRTNEWLYIRNVRPDRWPAGDPEMVFSVGPYGDIDGGVTKTQMLERRNDPAIARLFALATAKRPPEELYDLRTDPDQLRNVADRPQHAAAKAHLRRMLDEWMRTTGDPRVTADDDRWDRYPYYGQPGKQPEK